MNWIKLMDDKRKHSFPLEVKVENANDIIIKMKNDSHLVMTLDEIEKLYEFSQIVRHVKGKY